MSSVNDNQQLIISHAILCLYSVEARDFCPADFSLQSQEGELFREEVAEFWCVSPCALIETNCDDWEGGVLTAVVLVDV